MLKLFLRIYCDLQRFWGWAGGEHIDHVKIEITPEDFLARVGRLPCVDCIDDDQNNPEAPFCDYDLDAWFDAIMDDTRFDVIYFCDAH